MLCFSHALVITFASQLTHYLMKPLPVSISPCPIIDSIFEIRFSTNINENAVFGILYNMFKNDYPNVEDLGMQQIPATIRSIDPNFKYKPHYRINNNSNDSPHSAFPIQIGSNVITISSFPIYSGWNMFSAKIFSVLQTIQQAGIISEVERIGLRYLNFFEFPIFGKTRIQILLDSREIPYFETSLRTIFTQDLFSSTLNIANSFNWNAKNGSLIDIDTSRVEGLSNFFDEYQGIIQNQHLVEKTLFFRLLNSSFLDELNPHF